VGPSRRRLPSREGPIELSDLAQKVDALTDLVYQLAAGRQIAPPSQSNLPDRERTDKRLLSFDAEADDSRRGISAPAPSAEPQRRTVDNGPGGGAPAASFNGFEPSARPAPPPTKKNAKSRWQQALRGVRRVHFSTDAPAASQLAPRAAPAAAPAAASLSNPSTPAPSASIARAPGRPMPMQEQKMTPPSALPPPSELPPPSPSPLPPAWVLTAEAEGERRMPYILSEGMTLQKSGQQFFRI